MWNFSKRTAPMDLKDYRQPMVTSIGVILGFLMGFLGQWVTEPAFHLASAADHIVFTGTLVGVVLLLMALYRMLTPVLPKDVATYYARTLQLYMGGILVAFSSMLISAFV
jgi:divalent metal cation (Fe/Co/Zn/Cd) transporter